MISEKISAIQKKLLDQQVDWLLLYSVGHEYTDALVTYLLTSAPENALMMIPRQGKAFLYLTPFEVPEMQAKFPELIVRPLNQSVSKCIISHLTKDQILGIRGHGVPTSLYLQLQQEKVACQFIEQSEQWVAYKTPAEIAALRTVIAATDELIDELYVQWPHFTTEIEVAQYIKVWALRQNYALSFPPIVATGANAAEPHHQTNQTALTSGFCVIDLGLEIQGYCSDISRTVYIGEPRDEDMRVYNRVLASQIAAINAVAPGVATAQLDVLCRETLGDLQSHFIHGLGHGVGTAVHEWPSVSGASTAVLAPGMVITIEPGVYYSGKMGIRIEDDILVTETGYEILSQTSRELKIVPLPH